MRMRNASEVIERFSPTAAAYNTNIATRCSDRSSSATAGRTDSIRGGIRTTIDFVPDAPFTEALVRLQGARKGLLVNSRDICAKTYRATVRYIAHNGLTYVERPKLRARCGRRGRRGKRGAHKRGKRLSLAQRVGRGQ